MKNNMKNKIYELLVKLKCFLKGHKYNYQLGWGNGRYEDIYFCCDRCDKTFLKITQTQLGNQNHEK